MEGHREDLVFQVEQDFQDPRGLKETKETQGFQDMQIRGRKESLVSSWGRTGDLSTSGVLQDVRVTLDPRVLRDLQVLMVLQDIKERLGFQADLVARG